MGYERHGSWRETLTNQGSDRQNSLNSFFQADGREKVVQVQSSEPRESQDSAERQ